MNKLTDFSSVFSRFGDLVLAFLVVCIIGLLIVPLPTPMVDLLISVNLMISTVMLMLSLYLPRALAFSTFPTMLLFTTLYRLALNVTTTPLILLKADAGQIIYTFGNFVVGGNFIVGAVIFLIITIVQFVVIAHETSLPFMNTPMQMPPTMLIAVMMRPATASPFTNFIAPSIAP